MVSEICSLTAIIGEFKTEDKSYVVYILPERHITTPHIHIGDAQTFPMCSTFHCMLSLISPNYLGNTLSNDNIFNENQLEVFIRFITSRDEDGDPIWKYTLKTWNRNNENHKISIDLPIPNYINLEL